MALKGTKQNVPVALGIAMGFLGKVRAFKPKLWTGPCKGRGHCPILDEEQWAKGRCKLEECPRNLVHDRLFAKG